MQEAINQMVYSKNVIEFVAVSKEFCQFLENEGEYKKKDFLGALSKILPLLYLKGAMLPSLESIFEESIDKVVTEDDWNGLYAAVSQKLGQHNDYLEVFNKDIVFSEGPVSSSIADDLADIYQDLKDFIVNYGVGTEEIMNDAIWECKLNFEEYWGQKLVNSLRAVHNVLYNGGDLSGEDGNAENIKKDQPIDTSSWFISRRQEEFREDN